MLRNCEKLKRRKIVRFKISSLLSLQLLIAEYFVQKGYVSP